MKPFYDLPSRVEALPYMEQRALNRCVRVLLECEYRRWQRVSVALPTLSPGVDACRRTLNRRQLAIGLHHRL